MSSISQEESTRRQRQGRHVSGRPEGTRRGGDRRFEEEAQIRADFTFEDWRARFGYEEADAEGPKNVPSLRQCLHAWQ